MGSFHKNIQLMLEFLKAPFLVLHFTYYTLINDFPHDVICNIASMVMIPPSALNVIRHLICSNS